MVNFSKPLVISVMLAVTALPLGVHADEGKAESTLKVALWRDEFYADDAEVTSRNIEQTIDSMNKSHVDFTIFAADTKNNHTLCTDNAIATDVEAIFNSLK